MKIGTIGSGIIVHRFLEAVSLVDNVSVVACYSRSKEKGEALAKSFNIDHVYTDLNDLVMDKDINFIYIASPNSLHFKQAMFALENHKNVILEKPFCSTIDECEQLIKMAKKNKLFLFEAITTKYLPNYQIVKDNLDKVGNVKLISCNFSQFSSKYNAFKNGDKPNVFNPEFSGGALMDINVYNVHFVYGLFGQPDSYDYYPNIKEGIDTSGVLVMRYPNFIATLTGAKDCFADNTVFIQGDLGSIKVFDSSPGVCKKVSLLKTTGDQIDKKNPANNDNEIGIEQIQHMTYEIEAIYDIFRAEDFEKCYEHLDYSKEVLSIIYNARIKAGIKFSADN